MSLCSRHKLFRNSWMICLFLICVRSPGLCLAQWQNQDNISNLIQKLGRGTEDDRWSAAQVLGNMGNAAKRAAPDLEKALKEDKSESVRWAAAEALGKIGVATPTTIAALKYALNNDSDKNVRLNAAEALGNIGPAARPEALVSLTVLLNDRDQNIRWSASSAISRMGISVKGTPQEMINLLPQTVHDQDIRWRAVAALGGVSSDPEKVVLTLIEVLKNDSNRNVRANAAEALGRIGSDARDAVPALIKLLADTDQVLSRTAAEALGEIGPSAQAAVGPLTDLIEKTRPSSLRWRAALALGRIGPNDTSVIQKISALLTDPDNLLRRAAATALGGFGLHGKIAVSDLIRALDSSFNADDNVRWRAAEALGRIGAEAKPSIPVLTSLLNDPNKDIRKHAALALEDIAKDLYGRRDISAIEPLKASYKVVPTSDDPQVSMHATEIKKTIDYLEWLSWWDKAKWLSDHPGISAGIAVYPLLLLFCLLCLWVRPGWLTHMNDKLPESDLALPGWLGGNRISLRYLLLVGFFRYHPRVLDAWVIAQVAEVKHGFAEIATVQAREVYISIPVILNGKVVKDLKPEHLKSVFTRGLSNVLVVGEGGSGKTSLACQFANWAMSEDPAQRLSPQTLMLPVLVDQSLTPLNEHNQNPLLKAVGDQLRASIGRDFAVAPEFIRQLLARRRILVIIDAFSEMSEESRRIILTGIIDLPVSAVVITSRTAETLNNLPKTTIQPMRIDAQNLISFMDAYLVQREKRHVFDDDDFVAAYQSLSAIVGDGEITVLMARLYVEQMISAREEVISALPFNAPALFLNYLNIVYGSPINGAPDLQSVQRAAQIIAWECLKKTFRPMPADREDVLLALGGKDDALNLVKYLERNMKLLQTVNPENDLRFTLDPMAEYLAGLHNVRVCAQHGDKWRQLLNQVDETEGSPELIRGFLFALRECSLAKASKFGIPDFVAVELAQRLGLETVVLKKNALTRTIKQYCQGLRSPRLENRIGATLALSKLKKEREFDVAVPYLITALRDENYQVVQNAAKILADFEPAREEARSAFTKLLRHDDIRIVEIARRALERLNQNLSYNN